MDPIKIVSEAEASANAAVQAEAPKALSFFEKLVPLWLLGPAFLVGALAAALVHR